MPVFGQELAELRLEVARLRALQERLPEVYVLDAKMFERFGWTSQSAVFECWESSRSRKQIVPPQDRSAYPEGVGSDAVLCFRPSNGGMCHLRGTLYGKGPGMLTTVSRTTIANKSAMEVSSTLLVLPAALRPSNTWVSRLCQIPKGDKFYLYRELTSEAEISGWGGDSTQLYRDRYEILPDGSVKLVWVVLCHSEEANLQLVKCLQNREQGMYVCFGDGAPRWVAGAHSLRQQEGQ